MSSIKNYKKHVIVVGGGFAGLEAVRGLRKAPVLITLIDKTNHYCFQPLLYQVATAALNPAEIAQPLRGQLRHQNNCQIRLARVTDFKPAQNLVILENDQLTYDYLVLALGARNFYFGKDQTWGKIALGLKTLDDALTMRDRILRAFEQAEWAKSEEERAFYLTFIVIGAGPTGVELAGALSEIAKNTLAKNFRHFDASSARIIVIEGFERILPPFPAELAAKAQKKLEKMKVEIICGKLVQEINEHEVVVGNQSYKAATIIWAAGVKASPLTEKLGVPLDRQGRILVDEHLRLPGFTNIFAAGDIVNIVDPRTNLTVPGVAQSAMQMGRLVAQNISSELNGQVLRKFRYKDLGSLAQVGRGVAVAHIGYIKSVGFLAWCLWLFVHLRSIVGFNLKFIILFKWAWSFFTHERDSRLLADRALIALPKKTVTKIQSQSTSL